MNFRSIVSVLMFFAAVSAFSGCSEKKDPDGGASDTGINVYLPSSIDVEPGQDVSLYFLSGKSPLKTDSVILKKDDNETICPITFLGSNNFSFSLPSEMQSGDYEFSIRREGRTIFSGKTFFNVREVITPSLKPEDGATVYGVVHCAGTPLKGVAVTDGYNVVSTDQNGVYQLVSAKKNALVYISIPSGYMPQCLGVQALFWKKLGSPSDVAERQDFELKSDGNQTSHTMMFFGDMHLANRTTDDRAQFATFTSEVDAYVTGHGSEKIYAISLGDMTWDAYWYSNRYYFSNYLADINAGLRTLTVFHTIGNHDHDMKTSVNGPMAGWDAVDWDTANAFRNEIGPNYYSFNIGNIHYIVLDDIYCKNTTGGESDDRHYDETVCSDDLAWLKKDLKFVDKSTPVIVTMHAPVYNQDGSYALLNSPELVSCFSGFSHVRFVTGHSHKMWTVDSGNIHEHNSGAVCAAWWWSGYYSPTLNVAQDGAPGGYRIMTVNGKEYTSYFKGTGRADNYQFRSYDRNCIKFDMNVKYSEEFRKDLSSHGGYDIESNANQIIINVWDWNPSWKVEATENGKALTVTRFNGYDPIYHLVYSANRYKSTNSPNFKVAQTRHMFMTTASSASSTIEIKVTDDEGRVYTESMARPKAFSVDTYK